MCNSCGYCKYAKFEVAVEGRPCSAVDPIENEEDRKKVRVEGGGNGCIVCTGLYNLLLYLYFSLDSEQCQWSARPC